QEKQDFLEWAQPMLVPGEPLNKEHPFLNDITVQLVSKVLELKPGEKRTHRYLLYNGPIKVRLLSQLEGDKAVDPRLVQRYEETLHLSTLTDYRSPGFMGRFAGAIQWTRLLIFCTNVMHTVLWYLHKVIPVWGLCIIALTLLVRGMMFPVSRKQAMTGI